MVEYSVVLGSSMREVWAEQVLPLIDMVRNSPFLWPGIVAAAVALFLVTRLLAK